LRFFEVRRQKTKLDREAAEKMLAQVEEKFKEYNQRILQARVEARSHMNTIIDEAKKKEAEILFGAREQIKNMTKETNAAIAEQKERLKKSLEKDVEVMAQDVVEKLLVKR